MADTQDAIDAAGEEPPGAGIFGAAVAAAKLRA